LLTAVAMMAAGWDGSEGETPGFPKNGKWQVKWEGLKKIPKTTLVVMTNLIMNKFGLVK